MGEKNSMRKVIVIFVIGLFIGAIIVPMCESVSIKNEKDSSNIKTNIININSEKQNDQSTIYKLEKTTFINLLDNHQINNYNNPPKILNVQYRPLLQNVIVYYQDVDNDDRVRIGIDWDNDGVDQWSGYLSHYGYKTFNSYGKKGAVRVIAEDEHGAQSSWVSVKTKNEAKTINSLLLRFLENFPILYQLLQRLFNL